MVRRNILLAAKSAKIDETFSRAVETLVSLPDKDYERMLGEMLARTLENEIASEKTALERDTEGELSDCGEYFVLMSEKDRKRVSDAMLSKASAIASGYGKKVAFADRTADIDGGFILKCRDVELNCSIGLMIGQLRGELEADVCKILFG